MVRRTKATVTGKDPAYSHQFGKLRPIPSNIPPDAVIPGVTQDPPEEHKPAAEEPKPIKPSTRNTEKKPEQDLPKPKAEEPSPKPKSSTDHTQDGTGTKRVVMTLAVTEEHTEAMQPLIEKGLDRRDILVLAARRTSEAFEPAEKLVPPPEGNRRPVREAYKTTKLFPADLLTKLRAEHDPLGVKSDAAMIRGQYEALFWKQLDAVIAELTKQYC